MVNKEALVDKLCERLAVEKSGVEIYQAVLAKLGDPSIARRLERYQQEEAAHRDLLASVLERMGVTERETPSARLAMHEGQAYLRLIEEAETPAQLLNILLTVELMDENGWEMIVNLARDLGDEELARACNGALKDEKEHLRGVRGMTAQRVREMLTLDEKDIAT